ncbi:MAG: argininosuccinate lyase [Chloroflexi bacterium]|nr:argininosuccinate lyase [Chloroflexota bacterium]
MKLWGGRFSDSPDGQMRALNDSIGFDRALYSVDIQGSIAYAQALVEAGLLSEEEGRAIDDGLVQILDEFETNSFVFKPGDEDIHTAVERRLIEIIGPTGGKLHTGRSRNDQIATDIRLWLREACEQLNDMLENVQLAFIEQADRHVMTLMPGYTHLQPAQPITAGHWLMSFVWMLQRDRQRLAECRARVNISPLGSSALAGSPYPISREGLAKKLGFDDVTYNSLDAVSNRDSVAEFLFIASMVMLHLSRFAEDVVMYSNPAFGFIKLPDAFSTGSSIMPQKRNADPMELTRGKAGRVVGNLTGLLTTLKGLPSGYNKDLQEDKEPLFDTFQTLRTVLPVVAGMVRALTLNPDKMREALDDGLLATELADWLVLEQNIPFREAHHLVGQAVKLAEDKGVGLRDLALDDYQSISHQFGAGLYDALDFETAIRKRQSTGGTGTVREQITQARALLTPDADKLAIRALTPEDQERVGIFMEEQWGSPRMVSRGRMLNIPTLPGFVALLDDKIVGLVTYDIEDDACEITSLNSLIEGMGIGSKFIGKVTQKSIEAGCKRLWLITTNDNSHAIRWYQKRGFTIAAIHINALEESRRLKPEIPHVGNDGIPLRDEIELEISLIDME